MKHKDSKEPREWLEKAYHDLDAARKLYEQDGFPDTIALHCHQAAEKSLKGGLLWLDVEYPFTHDLNILLQLCLEKDKEFTQLSKAIENLLPLYEEQRYPFDEQEPYSDQELEDYINSTAKIQAFVKEKLKVAD